MPVLTTKPQEIGVVGVFYPTATRKSRTTPTCKSCSHGCVKRRVVATKL